MLVALTLGGVAAWGCGDDLHSAESVAEQQPASASGVAPATVEQTVHAQPVGTAKLLRVAPQHLQAVQQGLAQRLSRSTEGLRVQVADDGTQRIELEGRFGHVLIANQDETGKAQVRCAGSPEEVAKALGN